MKGTKTFQYLKPNPGSTFKEENCGLILEYSNGLKEICAYCEKNMATLHWTLHRPVGITKCTVVEVNDYFFSFISGF